MKKILIIFLVLFSFNAFSQYDVTLRKVTLDTLKARNDSVFVVSPLSAKVELAVRDTNIVDLIKYWGGPGSTVTFGNAYEIPRMNLAGTDFAYSSNFKWNDTTVYVAFGSNVFVGAFSGKNSLNTATNNVGLGLYTLNSLTTGDFNTSVGSNALKVNNGSYNIGFGYRSLYNSTGSNNTAIGSFSLVTNVTGNNNTSLGYESGNLNTGSGNLFIGYQAGYNETGSNKLYIDNSSTATPLIWGDFSTDSLVINGELTVTGQIKSVEPRIGAYLPEDSVQTTVIGTPDQYEFMGAGDNNKFINIYTVGFGFDGDTLQYQTTKANYFYIELGGAVSCSSVNETVHVVISINDVIQEQTLASAFCSTIGQEYPLSGVSNIVYLEYGDKIKILITSDSATTITTEHFTTSLHKIN